MYICTLRCVLKTWAQREWSQNLGRNVPNSSTLVGTALNRLPPLREYYLLQQCASKVAPCMRLQGCVYLAHTKSGTHWRGRHLQVGSHHSHTKLVVNCGTLLEQYIERSRELWADALPPPCSGTQLCVWYVCTCMTSYYTGPLKLELKQWWVIATSCSWKQLESLRVNGPLELLNKHKSLGQGLCCTTQLTPFHTACSKPLGNQ